MDRIVESEIYLNIRAKFWDKDIPTGNFKIEVIQSDKIEIEDNELFSSILKYAETNDKKEISYDYNMKCLEVLALVPAENLSNMIKYLENKYEINKKYTKDHIEAMIIGNKVINKEIVLNSISDDQKVITGKFKDKLLKDVIWKEKKYFKWLMDNNNLFYNNIKSNNILTNFLNFYI